MRVRDVWWIHLVVFFHSHLSISLSIPCAFVFCVLNTSSHHSASLTCSLFSISVSFITLQDLHTILKSRMVTMTPRLEYQTVQCRKTPNPDQLDSASSGWLKCYKGMNINQTNFNHNFVFYWHAGVCESLFLLFNTSPLQINTCMRNTNIYILRGLKQSQLLVCVRNTHRCTEVPHNDAV